MRISCIASSLRRANECSRYLQRLEKPAWRRALSSTPGGDVRQVNDEEPVYNQVNIQMLPRQLRRLMFPDATGPHIRSGPAEKLCKRLTELSQVHLARHQIPFGERRPALPAPRLPLESLPALLGNASIEEHFTLLGTLIGQPYYNMAATYARISTEVPLSMSHMQGRWSMRPGWTRYRLEDGQEIGSVAPEAVAGEEGEDCLVFDVETCASWGPWPVLAVAVSSKYLYGWVSPLLLSASQGSTSGAEDGNVSSLHCRLISLPTRKPLLIIGHHISYDRARILDEYRLERGSLRFLDTLSLHCAVSGLSSQQRGLWKSHQNGDKGEEPIPMYDTPSSPSSSIDLGDAWLGVSAMSNLADAVALHCGGYQLDKSPRNILVKGTLEDVRANFQSLMTYCANDVAAARGLFAAVWPKYQRKCPHPVSFAAILEMGSAFLPTNEDWTAYVEAAEQMYQRSLETTSEHLRQLVEAICAEGLADPERCKQDPWLSRLDWTPVPARYTKERRKADGTLCPGGESRPIGTVELFGKPAWYKKLWNNKEKRSEITSKARIIPYLMRMRWNGCPVHYLEEHGWCYCVPHTGDGETSDTTPESATTYSTEKHDRKAIHADEKYSYFKIPHHEEEGANVGSLMTKNHLKYYEKGILSTDSPIVKEIMQISSAYSFWVGYRERIKGQFVMWSDEPGVQLGYTSTSLRPGVGPVKAGMLLPGLITMGTVTRRAVEPTWMTASNPKRRLVGSEMKARIIAPDGYVFVGADVDSQELWISSLLGDAKFGFAGATALGWMTLQGAKSDGTDLHSRTASILGMSRDDAKVFNYGRIYGAGVRYAAQLLQKFNPTISKEEATEKARKLYDATKGRLARSRSGEDGGGGSYVGGTETFMFNVLEQIANAQVSRTPSLSASISDALVSGSVRNNFLTSRVNWAVQSSGVDYLHMLLVSVAYLARRHKIRLRLALTIHDEVRFLVKEEDQYRAALALQLANCWTRVMFAHRVGMNDLPLSVAFFSAVDFDRVLRKETSLDCVTPSNPTPVPPGFAMDIYKLLANTPNGLGPADPEFVRLEQQMAVSSMNLPPVVKSAQSQEDIRALIRQIGITEKGRTGEDPKNSSGAPPSSDSTKAGQSSSRIKAIEVASHRSNQGSPSTSRAPPSVVSERRLPQVERSEVRPGSQPSREDVARHHMLFGGILRSRAGSLA